MTFPTPFYKWRPHPWHGLEIGKQPPSLVNAYIEITPFDLVKYEIDKATGYLKVDRPQKTSSTPPTLYGIIPRTFCGDSVASLMPGSKRGDQDPLDICVVSERPITRAECIVSARVIGGIPMLDQGEADDKIVAILETDQFWCGTAELDQLPSPMIDRLIHYFSTYKLTADNLESGMPAQVQIGKPYGREHAERVVRASIQDYQSEFGE